MASPPSAAAKQQTAPNRGVVPFLLMLLWPIIWLCTRTGKTVSGAVGAVYRAVTQEVPRKGTLYYRLGRYHRSAEGKNIQLHCAPGSSGNKPRVVEVLRPILTLRYLFTSVPAQTLVLLLMLLTCMITSSVAMQTNAYMAEQYAGTEVTNPLPPHQMFAPPYTTGQVLALGLYEGYGCSFRCTA